MSAASIPGKRPSFIVIVGVVVSALAIVVFVLAALRPGGEREQGADPRAEQASDDGSETPLDESASVCGLSGEAYSGVLTRAPELDWFSAGAQIWFPISPVYGPDARTDEDVRYCFQRSPEGALFAAAAALAQSADPEVVEPWSEYFMGGPAGDQVPAPDPGILDPSGIPLTLAGFQLPFYDGYTATVILAFTLESTPGQPDLLASTYELVWEEGDWKLNVTDPERPIEVFALDDLADYVLLEPPSGIRFG